MSYLFILYKSPLICETSRKSLEVIERLAELGFKVDILLLSDSVVMLYSRTMVPKLQALKERNVEIYALKEDLEARGLEARIARPITYMDVISLIENHEKVCTWS
ncbi:MAG: sulfurtransferase complex subunit TusB [Candidatus Nezhaarchaeales archaeon]